MGRLGGDEFVVLAEGVSLSDGPEAIADRIRQVLRPAFYVEGFESVPLTVSASVGIAVGRPHLGPGPAARRRHRPLPGQGRRSRPGRRLRGGHAAGRQRPAGAPVRARRRTGAGQFALLYQPIVDLTDLRIEGVEALIRWNHPTKGLITPDRFIPVLEDSGQIVDVGRWVLDEACAQLARWRARAAASRCRSTCRCASWSRTRSSRTSAAPRGHGLDPDDLVIEITETVLMKDAHATVDRLTTLKELGVRIAIDDFGTGYSSLAYLRQFPVDVLKIDRTFVSEMTGSPDATALIHTLVELGRTLGLVTLAEGIEQASQIEGLRAQRCDHGQGYYFSRPVPASRDRAPAGGRRQRRRGAGRPPPRPGLSRRRASGYTPGKARRQHVQHGTLPGATGMAGVEPAVDQADEGLGRQDDVGVVHRFAVGEGHGVGAEHDRHPAPRGRS